MTRASWGSTTGDLGNLFIGLIDENRRRIEASVERDIQRSKEQQNAEDADMYDKWQNGLIEDSEWLDYVEGRVRDSRGEPEEHAEWVKTLREHRDAIRDAQLEAKYADGTISIHKLIAHYGDSMASVERKSPKYRETQARYYQLVDERDSYYIEDEANRILNQISRGKAGYGDLRDFYQSMLGKVRKSSPLYRQIKENIQSISQIGAATGGGGGSRSSGSSSGGSRDDRNPYSVASRAVQKLWKSGNVFVPTGKPVIQSVIDAYNIDPGNKTAVWNALGEDSVVIENLMTYAQEHPDAEFLVTPWGDRIPNTRKHRQLLMNQGLRTYEYRIALGNAQGRSILGVLSARDNFVQGTFTAENDADASDYWAQVRQNFWERTTVASQNPDPYQAMQEYAEAGRALEQAGHRLLGEPLVRETGGRMQGDINEERPQPTSSYAKTPLFPEQQLSTEMQGEIRYAIQLAQFSRNAGNLSPEELQHEASILYDQRPESFWLTESALEDMFGTDQITVDPEAYGAHPKVGVGLIGKSFQKRGLAVNDMFMRGEPVAGTPYQYVALKGSNVPQAVPVDNINELLGVTDYQDGKSTIGGWEKVGGRTQWVIRELEPVDAPTWWFNESQGKQGRWLDATTYEKYGRDFNKLAQDGWTQQPVNELANWTKVVDGDGRTWYRDPEDGFLYPDAPPFRQAVTGPVFDYTAFVNSDGSINFDSYRQPASTGRGFVAFFTQDVSAREAQELTEGILENPLDTRINPSFFHKRDDTNFVQPGGITPDDVVGMFWSESDANSSPFTPAYAEGMDRYRAQLEHEQALERAEIRRKAEVQSYIDARFESQKQQHMFEKMNPELDLQDFAANQIEQAKKLAGISMGQSLRNRMQKDILRQQQQRAEEAARLDIRMPVVHTPPKAKPAPVRPSRGVTTPMYQDNSRLRPS